MQQKQRFTEIESKLEVQFKGGPSDFETKTLQKYKKNHPYTPKAF